MEISKNNSNKKNRRVTSGGGPLEQPICKEKQFEINTNDEDLYTPLWAKRLVYIWYLYQIAEKI